MRTCVGCRVRAAKSELLRVGVVDEALVPDPRGQLPGRGASIHPDEQCIDLADRRAAFARALRNPKLRNSSALRGYVRRLAAPGPQQEQAEHH